MIVKAIELEFGLPPENVTDAMVRELRESALDNSTELSESLINLAISESKLRSFIERLQKDFRINTSFSLLATRATGPDWIYFR